MPSLTHTGTSANSTRSRRVCRLVAGVCVVGVFDLALTIHFMTTTGMHEVNPVARSIALTSPGLLVLFKAALTALSAGILMRVRDRASAEVGAWLAAAVMLALSAQWARVIAVDPGALLAPPTGLTVTLGAADPGHPSF